MKAAEIREKFLQFFMEKEHIVEPSASLVPVDDPSLLWINSGVATLKPYFDGRVIPDNPRITNSQKSIRTNDIENVGYTARHHTFFEMLGNFSIGDYFKEETILWAWEFLTNEKWLGLNEDKLSVTIHPEDEDALQIWHEKVGLPLERIIKLEENFWDIGEGPSGPNTEIFYDRGDSLCDPKDPECYPGGENERFLEIWNLVFSQFNHNPDGTYTPLPKKNIDTGMGLERIASVLQNAPTNYDTDLFQPIIKDVCTEAGLTYGKDTTIDTALKVIADHIRTIVFAVGDGVLPSNEGRGYVIRRLLRRAVRYGQKLGLKRPFLYQLTKVVAEITRDFYPEPVEKQEYIMRIIRGEEERFLETLNDGLKILSEILKRLKSKSQTVIPGKDAFKLYDTYGFPLDLTLDVAKEQGFTVDELEFRQEMERQRARARAARDEEGSMQVQGGAIAELQVECVFVGYDNTELETTIVAIIADDKMIDSIDTGATGLVLLAETPFYALSGGQIADQGIIVSNNARMQVKDVRKGPRGEHIHYVKVEQGSFQQGEKVTAQINKEDRSAIACNHTATHLLQQVLSDVLGDHINQAGSMVAADRLRFDFSHLEPITGEQLREIEHKINSHIWSNLSIETAVCSLDEAKQQGARALFGEKYGEQVRMVAIADYSKELCGGTHVAQTGEIGCLKIVSESSISSGVRRIEAVTGKHAFAYLNGHIEQLCQVAEQLKTNPTQVLERIKQLQQKLKDLLAENESIKTKLNRSSSQNLLEKVQNVKGIPVLAIQIEAEGSDLRQLQDELRVRLPDAVIVLGAIVSDKVQLIASVAPGLVARGFHAGKLVKEMAEICGGNGGGRPDMAQAGGKILDKLPQALEHVTAWVAEQS